MGVKKKFRGGLKLLLLLSFGILLGMCSTCYASITKEFLDYSVDYLYNSKDKVNITLSSTQNAVFENFRTSDTIKNQFINCVDSYLNNYNIINLTDVNCFMYLYYPSSTDGITFACIFSNASAPQGYENIGYVRFYPYADKLYFRAYGTSTDYIYVFLINVKSTSASQNYKYKLKAGEDMGYSSQPYLNLDYINFNEEHSIITIDNIFACAGLPAVYSVYPFTSNSTTYPMILKDSNGNYGTSSPEPDEPSGDSGSTGTITNPSGEVTGNIDLNGIENSLNNIENKIPTSGDIAGVISGEVGKITDTLTSQPDISNTVITGDDIESALNFEFESDPYANFWLELTNGLKNALLGTKRTIDITFQSRTWTIDLDDFAVLPAWLKIILAPFSTVFFVWVLVRWWKVILDKITSGNVDSVLKENSEERYF